jgi:hypothetical protein
MGLNRHIWVEYKKYIIKSEIDPEKIQQQADKKDKASNLLG